jgi:probable rRNA maturation factor
MILVETDVTADWSGGTDWKELAERAVRAAIASSRFAGLLESRLTVEVSVKLTEDDEARALNEAYRAKDKPTNVLSFPLVEPELIEPLVIADGGEVLLGDIVLAHGVCVREAREKEISEEAHAAHLLVHGTLHLLGHDHDEDERAEEMEEVERQAMAALGFADPYRQIEVEPELDARR